MAQLEVRVLRSLAEYLQALGSPTRLEILHQLRTPRALTDIRVRPTRSHVEIRGERSLSRQGVAHHLEQLCEMGLVRSIEDSRFPREVGYVVNQERVFAVVDELRSLTHLVPTVDPGEARPTITADHPSDHPLPQPPRLIVTYGNQDGTAFALDGEPGSTWILGRASHCEVRLPFDPFLSGENSAIEFTQDGPEIRELGGRNGTWVTFERLGPDARHLLQAGDILTVGRTRLVFQA